MIFKKSFSYIEIIFVILILSIFSSAFLMKFNIQENKLDDITKRLILYLKQTRIQAMIDEKFDPNDDFWYKKRWTLKFLRCKRDLGGLYFAIYSDTNKTGQINKEETLKDPLTNQYIYNNNQCEYKNDRSKYVLLTQEFDIVDVDISCNTTSSLGQLSFGSNGELYSELSSDNFLVREPCKIKLINKNGNFSIIQIEPNTGFVKKI